MILRFALGPDISQGDDWDKICNAAAEFGAAVSIAATRQGGKERGVQNALCSHMQRPHSLPSAAGRMLPPLLWQGAMEIV